jgi:hypothetical protein
MLISNPLKNCLKSHGIFNEFSTFFTGCKSFRPVTFLG